MKIIAHKQTQIYECFFHDMWRNEDDDNRKKLRGIKKIHYPPK